MKVTAILKGTKDDLGRMPVYIRLSEGQARQFRRTNLMILPGDFEKGKVKPSNPKHRELNAQIKGLIVDAETNPVVEEKGSPGLSFFQYCRDVIGTFEREKKREPGTFRQYESELRKLKGFREIITLADIDKEFLSQYSGYCYKLGNVENTVWKTFKFLRMMIRRAMEDDKILKNPFKGFEMPEYTDPEKKYFSRAEVEKLDDYSRSDKCPDELKFITTWFVIACWTGLRFEDCRAFDKKKNIRGGRLTVTTIKTGAVVSFPLDDRLKGLFERVNYRRLDLSNEYVNRCLKIISEANDLDPCSFHTSRHSFGTMASSAKIRREVISKMMGHADLRTTAIYAKLTGEEVDDELSKMR